MGLRGRCFGTVHNLPLIARLVQLLDPDVPVNRVGRAFGEAAASAPRNNFISLYWADFTAGTYGENVDEFTTFPPLCSTVCGLWCYVQKSATIRAGAFVLGVCAGCRWLNSRFAADLWSWS